eukprot:4402804-Prymnesium_polylepis.1
MKRERQCEDRTRGAPDVNPDARRSRRDFRATSAAHLPTEGALRPLCSNRAAGVLSVVVLVSESQRWISSIQHLHL